MSEENVELVRRGYAAWNRHDLDAMAALGTADLTFDWSNAISVDVHGLHEGPTEWKRLFRETWDMWEQVSIEPEELVAAGDQVVARVRFCAVGRGGVEVEAIQTAHVWTVRGGKLARCTLYQDKAVALEAAGLPE